MDDKIANRLPGGGANSPRLTVTGAALLAILATGAMLAWWAMSQSDQERRAALLQQARVVAQAVIVERVQALSGTEADLTKPNYLRLKDQLAATRAVNRQCRFLYLMGRKTDGTVFFFADSEPTDSKDYSPPGQVYEEVSEGYRRVFETRAEAVAGPVADRWGVWVSALIPLVDPQTGAVVAVLGMDIDARDWKWNVASAGIPPLVFTLALMGVLFVRHRMLRRRQRRCHVELSTVAAVGLLFTLVAVWLAHANENHRRQEVFTHLADEKMRAVSLAIRNVQEQQLEGLSRFLESNQELAESEFHRYADFLAQSTLVQAWEWVSALPASGKADFEHKALRGGLAGYALWQKDAGGQRVPVEARAVYYPVRHVAPLAGNEQAPGYDLGSEPVRRAALEEAARTGLPTCTEPITLVQETAGQKSILVFRPVFSASEPRGLRGFGLAVLRLGTVLTRSGGADLTAVYSTVILELHQLRTGASPVLLATSFLADRGDDVTSHDIAPGNRLDATRPLFAFGKAFLVQAHPGAEFNRLHPVRAGWLAAVTGLIATAAVMLVIRVIFGWHEELERLVAERTAALHENELHLRRITVAVESSSDAIGISDLQGKHFYQNKAFGDLFGGTMEEIQGANGGPLSCYADPEAGRAVFDTILSSRSWTGEVAMVARNGRRLTCVLRADAIRNDQGTILGVIGVHTDITERQRSAEVERQTAARRQRESATVAAIASSPELGDGVLLELAVELTEAAASAIGAKRVGLWLFEENETRLVNLDNYSATDGTHSSGAVLQEHEFQNEFAVLKDAQYVDAHEALTDPRTAGYVEGYLKPNRITSMLDVLIRFGGVPLGALCFEYVDEPHHWEHDEISFACQLADQVALAISNRERKRAEVEITRQASLINSLLDSIPDIIFFKDTRGVYLGCNPPFAEFVGKPREEIVGRTDHDLFDKELADSFREHDQRMLKLSEPRHNEEWITYPEGRKTRIDTLKTPYWGPEGELLGVLGISRDITEYKQATEALRDRTEQLLAANETLRIRQEETEAQREDLWAISLTATQATQHALVASRAKTEFLARMSHEIRTPLTAVIGYTDLLKRSLHTLPSECRQWVQGARRSADHLASLISDILDVSKIEAGQMVLNRESCSTRAILMDLQSLMMPLAVEKGLGFHLVCEGLLPEVIEADRLRLRQILVNLVGNAIKFTPHGRVIVRVSTLARDSSGGTWLRFAVEDTGIGIPAGAREVIFEPFVQGSGNSSRGGTGLGLDIARRLARAHGGEVTLQSEEGAGSTFFLTLPLGSEPRLVSFDPVESPVAESPSVPLDALARHFEGARILLVDDSPDNQVIIGFLLQESGVRPELASDGAAGVRAVLGAVAAGSPYHVILMDMVMPLMDGYAATRELRSRGVNTPIIAMTAHAMSDDRERCLAAGCSAYLSKPIDTDFFLDTVLAAYTGQALANSLHQSPGRHTSHMAHHPRFAPILRKYVADLPAVIAELEAARRDTDAEPLHTLVHCLHGTAANYGFPRISAMAAACEEALRDGRDVREVDELLYQLIHLLRTASAEPVEEAARNPVPSPG